MKWEYRDRFCGSNLYDEIVTTYETENENSPLKITETGRLNQHLAEKCGRETEQISLCWIYKDYRISNSKALVTDTEGQKRWVATYCVREAPTERRGTYKDRQFLTLEDATKFIDERIPNIEAEQLLQEMSEEEEMDIADV